MSTTTQVKKVKINKMSKARYAQTTPVATEFYMLTDVLDPQYESLPTADAKYAGQITQYTGVSVVGGYTNGYFYKCVAQGTVPETYAWEQTDVQPSSGGSSYTAGDGIDITNNVISNTGLINTATRSSSLTVLGTATTAYSAINIGSGTTVRKGGTIIIGSNSSELDTGTAGNGVVLGSNASVGGSSGIAIGYGTNAGGFNNKVNGIAIGAVAESKADYAIQLGTTGSTTTNSDANTFKVANSNGNFEMMSADGTIPKARLANVATVPSTTPTLTVAGWSNKSQTISVTGVTASNVVFVSPAPSSVSDYASAGIVCTAQAADSLTFTCETVPTSAIDLSIVIL